jgi:phosphoribosyl-ATP pyrophosphohydrolase/phosphoribosyl-AMP cyclohydrolase
VNSLTISYDKDGLVPAIAVCSKTKAVLMLAYMNAESLDLTLKTGYVHYYSRSRKCIWKKGETSGHTQKLKAMWVDCDEDALLLEVEQEGACCHEGYPSCFFRTLNPDKTLQERLTKSFDPKEVYGKKGRHIMDRLFRVIESRKAATPGKSYVASLFHKGQDAIEAKVQEEVLELFDAAREDSCQHTVHEAADVLFHTLVLLSHAGIPVQSVWEELERRFGTSGHEEKQGRSKRSPRNAG